ncbi:hypothetical protein CTI12_AA228360 [Artemisia annua]|uniref:FH2 domain-containing protein n=1 Tax=Artemisia annua TaxID=35608 RepID=A0A2U1NTX2_ARTAN|nr:hypothetical protein CTI12_AA228360 [Artemisia annua]
MELMRVPRAESMLRVFSFKLQFNAQIMSSAKLKTVMQTILSLGNALNHGTRRGDAIGFRLESLLKLTDIRSDNNRTSLMHYLCKVLADKQPELLNFSKDLGGLVHASKLLVKSLADDMHAITTALRNVMLEKRFAKKEGPLSKRFPKIQLKFLAEEMQAIKKGLEKVGEELSMAENDGPISEKFRKVRMSL